MTQDIKKLASALDQIATFFTEEYEHIDAETGVATTANAFQFSQKKVLNSICYALANGIDYTVNNTLKNAQRRLATVLRDADHEGDTKVQLEIDKVVTWIERLQIQLEVNRSALRVAEAAYERAIGEPFEYSPRGAAAPASKQVGPQTELQKRIAAARQAA